MDVETQMPFVFPGDSGHIINLDILLNSMEEEAVSSPEMVPPSPGSFDLLWVEEIPLPAGLHKQDPFSLLSP